MTEQLRIQEKLRREIRVLQIFQDLGVIRKGHFVFKSGLHSDTYLNKDKLYPHPLIVEEICEMLTADFEQHIDVVAAPEKGGILLSNNVARILTKKTGIEVLSIFAEKDGDDFRFGRGYEDLINGKRFLLVEDNLTTGGSLRKVVDKIRIGGGIVVGASAICNRGNVKPEDVGIKQLNSLLTLPLNHWPALECPPCRNVIPIDDLGHGAKFLAARAETVFESK